MKRFSEDHQWVEVRNGIGTVGITAYAAEELGEITFIELPEKGDVFAQGDVLCVIESVKTASDVIAPISGSIHRVNERLEEDTDLLNSSPEKEGWICRFEEVDLSEMENLMTEKEYEEMVGSDGDDD